MLDYKLTKFENGLKVITAPLSNTKAVSVFVLVKTGSRFEKEEENGIAHFLEHMFFKGTKKRPKSVDIARELDSVGASYNAFTGEEYTGFYVRVESSHFDLGLDILQDILYNSLFGKDEIAKEKGVILEEINMIKDLPAAYVEYVMKELLYGSKPLGRMITGTRETVSKFSRDDIESFKKRFYQPENMIVAVAGGNDPSTGSGQANWLEKIKNKFGEIEKLKPEGFEKIEESQTKPELKIFNKATDQAHFILGFRSIKRTDERRPILKVLNNILGATMSSRLFSEVREKRGLCYYISSDIADFQDTGFWGVGAGVDIKRIAEAIKVILEEFGKIRKEEVSDEELKRAQDNLKGHLYLGLEESMAVAQFLAEQEMFWEKIDDPDQVVSDFQKVTKSDIKKLASDLFRKEKLNLAVVGPFERDSPAGEEFQKILERYR
ncbi:hypothetical protein A2V71_01955 [Candidatus Berkelbacteria bacterium RBG_13_40_8]|uniref:Peptidase M16 n=1 Tax=Candidatus Berkelbacteria bacterium RBG_13_40_8 TaxID=1797467 RepID=A0A1F5DQB7_9BACT|nr:MAG: hypothetical protein A2V71_01955 [Candidatus Berkelbacteria bacterium RBG_13_40_8]